MKLSELSLNSQEHSLPDIIKALQSKREFKHARGKNAFVIDFPGKNYVYRVWLTGTDGYDEFVKYLKTNSSPHLIKLLSPVRTIETKSGKISFVKIEKLTPILLSYKALVDILGDVFYEGCTLEEYQTEVEDKLEEDNLNFDIDKNLALVKVCYDLCKSGANDIFNGNAMMRGKIVVITDPFSNDMGEPTHISAATLVFPDKTWDAV